MPQIKHKGLVDGAFLETSVHLVKMQREKKTLWSNWMVELMSHMLQRLNCTHSQGLQVQVVLAWFILSAEFCWLPQRFPVGEKDNIVTFTISKNNQGLHLRIWWSDNKHFPWPQRRDMEAIKILHSWLKADDQNGVLWFLNLYYYVTRIRFD